MSTTGLWRAVGVMTVGTAASRLTGLLRVAAMTYALGITGTRLADTYNLANTTPNIVYELFLGGILTSVFIPVLIEAREGRRGDASALVSVSLVALAVLSAVTAIAAPLIMRIYTFRISDPATKAAQLELASFLLRAFAPQIFFYGLSTIAQALLNVRGRFGAPAFAPVANNLVVTAVFFTYGRVLSEQGLNLTGNAKLLLGLGTTAGVAVQAIVLAPLLAREGLKFRLAPKDPAVRRVLKLGSFVIGYVITNQVLLWVVLALANGRAGGVTSWNVAYWFFQLPHGLAAVSIYTALFPDLSRSAERRDWGLYRRHFTTGVRGVALLLLPAAAGYIALADEVTRLILAHGVATTADAEAVARVLRFFALGLPFFSAFHLFTRSFYALADTRTPTTLNAAAVIFNIGIDLPLYAAFGVRGLALGHAMTYAAGSIALGVALSRRIPGGIGLRHIASPILRMALLSAVMGTGVEVVSRAVPGPDIVVVGAGVLVGLGFYLGAGRFLLDEPVLSSIAHFRRSDDTKGEGGSP